MRLRQPVAALMVITFIATACGGSGAPARPLNTGLTLEKLLPEIMLTADEMEDIYQDRYTGVSMEIRSNYYRTNEEMAAELPGLMLFISNDLKEIRSSGRVTGYLAHYSDAGGGRGLIADNVALDLYRDEAAAQAALERRPFNASHNEFVSPVIGDAARAWLIASVGGAPDCPCELYFRVGRLVSAVVTSYHGPFPLYDGEPDPFQLEIGERLAERMRQAIAANE